MILHMFHIQVWISSFISLSKPRGLVRVSIHTTEFLRGHQLTMKKNQRIYKNKEKSLTLAGFQPTTSGPDHRRANGDQAKVFYGVCVSLVKWSYGLISGEFSPRHS